ncbi:MAG: HAMP domain-containing histidine kinase [Treponema sp.]|jgi:signal transduction histidine kinase|nr:HAMP domain-containing histidine kinase [Treponema sp.]
MTIKKRFFISGIIMANFVLSVYGLTVFFFVTLKSFGIVFGAYETTAMASAIMIVVTIIIVVLFTYRYFRIIIVPLDILGKGVRQLHAGNLAYRIVYHNKDEFRPVCDTFNEMAGRIESMIAERAKDEESRRELIAGISHDLRTPLTSIKAYLEGLETGVASDPERIKKYYAIIKNKTKDLEHIINQLFLFSKLDLDNFPVDSITLDMRALVGDMIMELSGEYEKRGLAIELGEVPYVFINLDPVLFRTVIVNILENSAKYKTAEHGRIAVSCLPVSGGMEIRLSDDGPGVSEEALQKLFDVFYRADPSRSRKGNGLGLAISRKIINRMNGTIRAETGFPPWGGLSVIIFLPAAAGVEK